jgi:hypothetical protein
MIFYGPGGLAAMVMHRYTLAPVIKDYRDTMRAGYSASETPPPNLPAGVSGISDRAPVGRRRSASSKNKRTHTARARPRRRARGTPRITAPSCGLA